MPLDRFGRFGIDFRDNSGAIQLANQSTQIGDEQRRRKLAEGNEAVKDFGTALERSIIIDRIRREEAANKDVPSFMPSSVRAAETAGISTGYMPASVYDKTEMEQDFAREMAEQKRAFDMEMQQGADLRKTQDGLSPHDRASISLLQKGIETPDDIARAWDAYSSVRGIKGTESEVEAMAGLVGDQDKFLQELVSTFEPNGRKAAVQILNANLSKGLPLAIAALADKLGGTASERTQLKTKFQNLAQKHLDKNKLTDALSAIYYPHQQEAYRQGMEREAPQISEADSEAFKKWQALNGATEDF